MIRNHHQISIMAVHIQGICMAGPKSTHKLLTFTKSQAGVDLESTSSVTQKRVDRAELVMRNHHQNSEVVVYIQGIYITRAESAIQMLIFNENHAGSGLATVRKSTPKRHILDDFWGVWEPTNSLRLQIAVDIKGNQL